MPIVSFGFYFIFLSPPRTTSKRTNNKRVFRPEGWFGEKQSCLTKFGLTCVVVEDEAWESMEVEVWFFF